MSEYKIKHIQYSHELSNVDHKKEPYSSLDFLEQLKFILDSVNEDIVTNVPKAYKDLTVQQQS